MPMIDDVAETLVREPEKPGRASDAPAGSVECVSYQFAFTLVDLFFKRTSSAQRFGLGDSPVRHCQSSASTKARRTFRIQLISQSFVSFPVHVSNFAGGQKVFKLFENGKKHSSGYVKIAGSFCDMSGPFQQAKC